MSTQREIEQVISEVTGISARIIDYRNACGGSINNSRTVKLEDGREFFIKSAPGGVKYPGMFAAEFKGLELLAAAGTIRVPKPVVYGQDFIVLEIFYESAKLDDWYEKLGRQLAHLHRASRRESYGFDVDNYLGTTPQPNTWTGSWLEFWRDQRLGWQLEMFSMKTSTDDRLLELGDLLIVRLENLLGGVEEPAVLLHGDLWSGNAAADESGEPIIYDPACYYGHREAELGIMRMFGGFGKRCEEAYNEVWPWEKDIEDRIAVYRLYHELNHLNLFGKAYYQSCLDTLASLV